MLACGCLLKLVTTDSSNVALKMFVAMILIKEKLAPLTVTFT